MTLSLYPSRLTQDHIDHAYPECWDEGLKEVVRRWLQELQQGVRPLTMRSIQTFRERLFRYSLMLGKTPVNLRDCMDISNIYTAISNIPIESFSSRNSTYCTLLSFAKFLIQQGQLDSRFIENIKPFRPKRVFPPKRTVLRDQSMLAQVRQAIQPHRFRSKRSYLTTLTIFETFVQTGLRNNELCQLKLADVDLINHRLKVYLGKGRKDRIVGISKQLSPYLECYLFSRQQLKTPFEHLFLNYHQKPYNPVTMSRLIQRVCRLANLKVTPHGLRRTFATLNAEQGKPLHLIQLALGHSDIRTTQEYLCSDQEAMIEAMRNW